MANSRSIRSMYRFVLFAVTAALFLTSLVSAPALAGEAVVVLPINAVRQVFIDKYGATFSTNYPQYKILPIHGDNAKVLTLLSAGTPPAAHFVAADSNAEFVEKGVLLDIRPLMERDGLKMDAFFGATADAMYYKGGLYGLPGYINQSLVFYNPNIFAQAGIPIPPEKASPTWSWEAIRSLARKFTIDANGDGTPEQWGVSNGPSGSIASLLSGFGGRWFDKDIKRFTGDSAAGLACLRFWADWFLLDGTINSSITPWNNQKAAITVFRGANAIPVWEDRKYSWDIAPMPWGQITDLVGTNFRFFAGNQDIEAAWSYIKPLVYNPDLAAELASVFGGLPSLRSALMIYAKNNSWLTPRRLNLLIEATEHGEVDGPAQLGIYYLNVHAVISEEVDKIITGKVTVPQGLENIKVRTNEYLNK